MAMTRTFATRAGVVAALALGAAAPRASAQSGLRYEFQAGQTLRYDFQQKNEIKVKANGQETGNSTALTIGMTWKVKSAGADGGALIVMNVDRVQAKITAGPQKIDYDTKQDKPNDDPASKALDTVYRPAIGQDYTFKIDPRGQITETKVPEKVSQALQGSPFMAIADGGSILTEKGLKNLFAQVIPVLPEKPLAKGGSWKSSLDLPVAPLHLTLEFINTLADDGPNAKVTSKIDTGIKPQPGVPFTVELKKQSGDGTFTYDTRAGRLTGSAIKQTIELNLGFMNRQIEQTIDIDEHLTLVR